MENPEDGWNIRLEAAKERNSKMHVRAAWIKHEEKKKWKHGKQNKKTEYKYNWGPRREQIEYKDKFGGGKDGNFSEL